MWASFVNVELMKGSLLSLSCLLLLLACDAADAAKIRYHFADWEGPRLRVSASRSPGLDSDRPVVIVMHGVLRDADRYRDQWHELALENDFLLLVPEFSEQDFPGSSGYQLGYMHDQQGRLRPRGQWAYSAIEPLFDDARRRFGMQTNRYALYGHSAGAQFAHRFVFHVPRARASRVVPANAGWYMMPDYDVGYPYGFAGSGIAAGQLAAALQQPVTLMLGKDDIDAQHQYLRQTPPALVQGPHRLARGELFFATARAYATRTGTAFNWRLVVVEGVGHDNGQMAAAAVPYLIDPVR